MAGSTGVAFTEGNHLEILDNGDAFYPAMLQAIEGAVRSITMEAYIYWAGHIGRTFARALAARARVRQLDDAFREDLAHCDRIRLRAWRRRGAWVRIAEVFASLFREQV